MNKAAKRVRFPQGVPKQQNAEQPGQKKGFRHFFFVREPDNTAKKFSKTGIFVGHLFDIGCYNDRESQRMRAAFAEAGGCPVR